jgi:hypothetical protein
MAFAALTPPPDLNNASDPTQDQAAVLRVWLI